ncbi:LuxR C-terminal-related transcriptional regulator [Conexibacter sp. SYSU D00693]|uniref:LuxR C-terminal-related transcriptional regulator n=1 Tax=Conexibacter sp. SYSU D00693 TaxID=2812560 RepID=UPI00196B776D|nr:LuxR C-terminal-related transcriptional regulator [Conexibacter sp. SYSU D00693]
MVETATLREELAAAMARLPPWPPADDAGTPSGGAEGGVELELRRRLDTLAAVHEALARLRRVRTVEGLIARAPQEVCGACGFDRCVVYQVRGPELIAESFHVDGDPATAERLLAFSRRFPLQLRDQVLEREMVRRRIPMTVQDVMDNPRTFKPLAEVYDTHSYVAAPILPEGRVIGFVHADHRHKPRRVDEVDRDALWAFAEGLGLAIERNRLAERLQAQGEELQRLLRRAQAVVSDYREAGVELVSHGDEPSAAMRTAEALLGGPTPELEEGPVASLSPREREVLALLAGGASNAQIAERLFIADETAKSHVKHVLRKLGAANRVEAAAFWLRAQQDGL